MLGCRLTADQMLAISDADLIELYKRALPAPDQAPSAQIDTHATRGSQQPAESPRTVAAANAQDDEATLPIPDDELSPRIRSFIRQKHREPATPANRQILEAWRAGEADVSPSKAAAGGLLTAGATDSTQVVAAGVPRDERTAAGYSQISAPAAADTPSATVQLAPSVSLPDRAVTQHPGSQAVPKPLTLLQAVLKGRE